VYFSIHSKLKGKTNYTVIIDAPNGFAYNKASIADTAPGTSWTFSTPDVTCPSTTGATGNKMYVPAPDEKGVGLYEPSFTVTFDENVTLASAGNAQLWDNSTLVATLDATLAGNVLTLSTPAGTLLSPETVHSITIPYGYVVDSMGNKYFGITQCSGCDWQFTSATSNAPTIVNAPGAACNNTESPGTVAVSPGVSTSGVDVSVGYVDFRFCVPYVLNTTNTTYMVTSIVNKSDGNGTISSMTEYTSMTGPTYEPIYSAAPNPGSSGYIRIVDKESQTTLAGIDLSQGASDLVSSRVVGTSGDDSYRLNVGANTLKYSTTYTVVVPHKSFYSYTMEPNQAYQWDFTTAPAPPPIRIQELYPVNGLAYNATSMSSVMQLKFNDTYLKVGVAGKVCMYTDHNTGEGYELTICTDMSNNTVLEVYTTSQTRRAWGAPPLRRGESEVNFLHKCSSQCVSVDQTNTNTVTMEVPAVLSLINEGYRYQGSADSGTVTGAYGQTGPAVTQSEWGWKTLTVVGPTFSAAVVSVPVLATGVDNSFSEPWWVWALIALGGLLLLVAAIGMYMYKRKERLDKEAQLGLIGAKRKNALYEDFDEVPYDSDFSDFDDDDEEGSAIRNKRDPGVGAGPGSAARGYKDPVMPDEIPHLDEVSMLYAQVEKIQGVLGNLENADQESVDSELRRATVNTAPKKLRESMMIVREEIGGKEELNDAIPKDITKADIKLAAVSIVACEKLLASYKQTELVEGQGPVKVNQWKVKTDVMQGLMLAKKMKEIGEPLPCLQQLLKQVWRDLKPNNEPTAIPMLELLIAQAWPEVTRLRLERSAKLESLELMEAMQSTLANSITDSQLSSLLFTSEKTAELLSLEANTLEAAASIGAILPIFAPEKFGYNAQGKLQLEQQDLNDDVSAVRDMQSGNSGDPESKADVELVSINPIAGDILILDPAAVKEALLNGQGKTSSLKNSEVVSLFGDAGLQDGDLLDKAKFQKLLELSGLVLHPGDMADFIATLNDGQIGFQPQELAQALVAAGVQFIDGGGAAVAVKIDTTITPAQLSKFEALTPLDKLMMADGVVEHYHNDEQGEQWSFIIPQLLGSMEKLKLALEELMEVHPTVEEGNEELTNAECERLKAIVVAHCVEMIKLHANSPTIAGAQMEKLLVAAQRTAEGSSSIYYLKAIIDEVGPQLSRIEEKEHECAMVCDIMSKLENITDVSNTDSPQVKHDAIKELLISKIPDILRALNGHQIRYISWLHDVPPFTQQKALKMSAELTALSTIVTTCEAVAARANDDVLQSAYSTCVMAYRPTCIKKGDTEKLARSLVAMEKFIHGDETADLAYLEEKTKEGFEPLERLADDMRMDMAKLRSAFDMTTKVINQGNADQTWLVDGDYPAMVPLYTDVVYDAWGNLSKLQGDTQANKLSKDLVNVIAALKSDDIGLDEFHSQVLNVRAVLQKMIEDSKDLNNEQTLLAALAGLQAINDADKMNIAVRETKCQLNTIIITEEYTTALKTLYDDFNFFLDDKEEGKKLLQQCVQNYSNLVVRLGAADDDPFPLRTALKFAVRCCEGMENGNLPKDYEIKVIIEEIIAPQVMGHLSAPKASDLEALMEAVQGILASQKMCFTVQSLVTDRQAAQKGSKEAKEAMDEHRRRLAYRQRMQVKKDADEVIELRKAEKCGAEWDGFHVEDVVLKKRVEKQKSPIEEAFSLFDIDQNGTITIGECIQFLLSVSPDQRPNGLKDINPFQKAKMRKRVEKMDTNGDGTLSFAEFEEFWKANDNAH